MNNRATHADINNMYQVSLSGEDNGNSFYNYNTPVAK